MHDPNFPMTMNLNATPKLLGLEATLCPLVQFVSSQRSNMFSHNSNQALILDGCQFPRIASGYEREFLKYNFNNTRFEQNATTLVAVPKYRVNVGAQPINISPSYTLIYLGEDDLIHCMEVPTFVKGTDGFGYEMSINYNKLTPDIGIEAGEYIAKSKAVQGSKYCLGVNLNVCYMTTKETVEDACAISDYAAKNMESTGYKTLVLNINKDMVPLNLYGNEDDEYKFIPDIGERVRDDCILCAFRTVNDTTMVTDMSKRALTEVQYLHDEIYFAVANDAEIVDIDVYENPSRKVKTPDYIFEQLEKYKTESLNYHRKIMDIYEKECLLAGKEPAPEFNSLVTRCASYLIANKQKVFNTIRRSAPKLSLKNEPISFIQIVITYKFKNKVTKGHKTTGREGNKGVVSNVIKREHMPVNDYGVISDMVMAPVGAFNRMNLSQLYEQFINCTSQCVIKIIDKIYNSKTSEGLEEAYSIVLEYCRDVNPEYAKVIEQTCNTYKRKDAYIYSIIKNRFIILVIPPFLDNITPEWVLMMTDKYKVDATPVEYNLTDENGNVIRRVRTLRPIWIGECYRYLLCKIPYARSCGVGYVNQWRTPIRVKSAKFKAQYPIGLTPIRVGEDENRNIMMMAGENIAFRILSLYANNPDATEKLAESLLTEDYPTRLSWVDMTDEQLRQSNQMINVTKHLMRTIGVDIENSIIAQEEKEIFKERVYEPIKKELKRKRRTKKEIQEQLLRDQVFSSTEE